MFALDELYQKLQVPPPKLSPEERYQRRLAWRNERVFCKRKCDYSARQVLSIFSEKKPFPVYAQDIWWSDCWDAQGYGREFDFSRPFFPQFKELLNVVPQRAMNSYASENCEYTNQSMRNKNCYLLIASSDSQDCYYSMWAESSGDCMDCLYIEQCELCYELISAKKCYECTFSEVLESCVSCHFCRDCIGCKNCFGSTNLRNKEYYFFNQPFSPEEYLEKLASFRLNTRDGQQEARLKVAKFFLNIPRKYYVGISIENSTGDFIQEVKNSQNIFNCRYAESLFFSQDAWRANFSTDLTETIENNFCIELEGCGTTNECGFSMKTNEASNAWYCSHCSSGHDLFGCVGLRNANYCILNRQYSSDGYFSLRAKIVSHMRQTGEWGEHFPIELSPFGYNETVAAEYFPLSREQVVSNGWNWEEEAGIAVSNNPQSPESPDTKGLLEEAYSCKLSQRAFRIISAERDFYKRMQIPVPALCQDVRHQQRMARRNSRRLNSQQCSNCQAKFLTTSSTTQPVKLLCENCYLEIVD